MVLACTWYILVAGCPFPVNHRLGVQLSHMAIIAPIKRGEETKYIFSKNVTRIFSLLYFDSHCQHKPKLQFQLLDLAWYWTEHLKTPWLIEALGLHAVWAFQLWLCIHPLDIMHKVRKAIPAIYKKEHAQNFLLETQENIIDEPRPTKIQ